jgi:hypothetical protein
VFVGLNRFGALAALAMAVALSGCGGIDFDTTGSWFSKPLDVFGSKGGYTYSNVGDAREEHPITANDLVDANGACPGTAPPPAADNAGAASSDMASLLGGGIAIGMSECEVIARLGQPTAVNLGRGPSGDRSAIMTFRSGPRPGIYRFEAGRLSEMDRVEEAAPAPRPDPAKKKSAKKEPAKKKPEQPQPPPNTNGKN